MGVPVAVTVAAVVGLGSTAYALWRDRLSPLTVMQAATAGTVVLMTISLQSTIVMMAAGGGAPLGVRLLAYGVVVSGLALLVLGPRWGIVLSVAAQVVWVGMVAAEPVTRQHLADGGEAFAAARYGLIALALLWGMTRTSTLLQAERDRLQQEARRTQADEQLRRAHQERRARAMAEAAHELRGPLSTLALGAETLAEQDDGLDADGRRRVMAALQHAARRLDQRTIDLLDAARDSADEPIEPELVDPVAEVARTLEDLSLVTRDHDVRLHGAQGTQAHLDPDALDHIVTNLVHNATKYAPAGSSIEVSVRRAEGATVLRVADHGPGVPDDLHDGLFDPYARSTSHDGIDGTGVGLAVTRSWARRHGGDARLLAAREGAVFEVLLPDVD